MNGCLSSSWLSRFSVQYCFQSWKNILTLANVASLLSWIETIGCGLRNTVNPKTFLPTLRHQPLRFCCQCSQGWKLTAHFYCHYGCWFPCLQATSMVNFSYKRCANLWESGFHSSVSTGHHRYLKDKNACWWFIGSVMYIMCMSDILNKQKKFCAVLNMLQRVIIMVSIICNDTQVFNQSFIQEINRSVK